MSFDGISILRGTFAAPIGPGARGPADAGFTTRDPDPVASRAAFAPTTQGAEAQSLRDAFLQALSLTETGVRSLPSDERERLNGDFLDLLKRQSQSDGSGEGLSAGLFVNLKA